MGQTTAVSPGTRGDPHRSQVGVELGSQREVAPQAEQERLSVYVPGTGARRSSSGTDTLFVPSHGLTGTKLMATAVATSEPDCRGIGHSGDGGAGGGRRIVSGAGSGWVRTWAGAGEVADVGAWADGGAGGRSGIRATTAAATAAATITAAPTGLWIKPKATPEVAPSTPTTATRAKAADRAVDPSRLTGMNRTIARRQTMNRRTCRPQKGRRRLEES